MTLLATCALALLIQDPGEVLARYRLGDKPAVVTRTDVAVEMAFHLRQRQLGKDACQFLVDAELTRRAAEREGLMPTEQEVREYWETLQQQLRAAGRDPTESPAVRNSTEAEWFRDLAVQIAQERLVRKALGTKEKEVISGDMLRLWITEQRKKATVITNPSRLPLGTAARVDGREIALVDLGVLLLRTSEDEERQRSVRRVVYLECIERRGKELGIEVHPTDLQEALDRRRREAAKDPRFRGLTFEQLLETQGLTVQSLLSSRVFRAKVLEEKLTDALHPGASLERELADHREAVDARLGARRRLGIIFRRALEEPNAIVPDDFESASRSLAKLRKRLAIERFDTVARIETDDPRGKQTGGDIGWIHAADPGLPSELLLSAFEAEKEAILGPFRGKNGCYLVKVLDVEPQPDDAELLRRLRGEKAEQLTRQILVDAAIEWPETKPGQPQRR